MATPLALLKIQVAYLNSTTPQPPLYMRTPFFHRIETPAILAYFCLKPYDTRKNCVEILYRNEVMPMR